jgi:SAM-dependent methyltransferase
MSPMLGFDWLAWLASIPPAERDAAVEEYLGIAAPAPSSVSPGEHLIGYHPSGVASIVRALIEVPVRVDDVVIDLGAGLGKVVLLAHLLTGATARGIEIQPLLVDRARDAARRLGASARFTHADVRDADVDDGTVFFLYLPFTGPALTRVLQRLHAIAKRRAIVVCSLGLDLDKEASWLVRRSIASFWLALYDSSVPGVARRSPSGLSPLAACFAHAIVLEHPLAVRRLATEHTTLGSREGRRLKVATRIL